MLLLLAAESDGTESAAAAEEAPLELLHFDLGDSGVSLLLKGSWKGTLTANWGMSRSELGWQGAAADSPLLFSQEAELSLSLWLRERWFVEAGFLDGHEQAAEILSVTASWEQP
jgi:hypothetical protein